MRRVDFTLKAAQRFQEIHENILTHQSEEAAQKFLYDFIHPQQKITPNNNTSPAGAPYNSHVLKGMVPPNKHPIKHPQQIKSKIRENP